MTEMPIGSNSQIESWAISDLKPYAGNARVHSKKQIKQIARSIERFGFTNPVLVGECGTIIAGHGRVAAAIHLGWKAVPVLSLKHLGLVTDLCRSAISLCHLGFECERADAAQI